MRPGARPAASSVRSLLFVVPLIVSASGCGLQALNSFSNDEALFTPATEIEVSDEGDARFAAARVVLQANCAECHSFPSYTLESQFTEYYVVEGDPDSSVLYRSLKDAVISPAATGGEADMPNGASALSSGDLETIRTWIARMGEDDSTEDTGPDLSTKAGRLQAALSVLDDHGCLSCHTSTKPGTSTASGNTVPAFANYSTDAEFNVSGLVSIGDSSASWIIRSLKDWGDYDSMPKTPDSGPGGDPLSAEDYQTLVDWIDGMDD